MSLARDRWDRSGGVSLLLALVTLLMVVASSLPATSYSNDQGQVLDNATSCGDATSCHSAASSSIRLLIEGPHELKVNQMGWYNVTLLGGPGKAYGFYIVVTNSNGIAKTITGDLLVPVTTGQALNVTQDRPLDSNSLSFNVSAPKYAGRFIIRVAYNSVNGNGLNDSQDQWASQVFDIQVKYPEEVVGWDTFKLGMAAFAFAAISTLAFRQLKRNLGA